jgi:hypothetical protein
VRGEPFSGSGVSASGASVSDTAYDATSWNSVTDVAPSKNAVRDKIESLSSGSGVPLGTIDTTVSPYSIVADDTSAAAANGTALALAITNAAGAKRIVLPAGTVYVDLPSSGSVTATSIARAYRFSTSGDLFLESAVPGFGKTKLAFYYSTGYCTYHVCMFRLTSTAVNFRFKGIEFGGPASLPSPMPSFVKMEDFYDQMICEFLTNGANGVVEDCKSSGHWSIGFFGLGGTFNGGGEVKYVNSDIYAEDMVCAHFTDATNGWGPDYRLKGFWSKFRSNQFTTRSFITAATIASTTVTVTTDRPHNLVANDTFILPKGTGETSGIPGITGLATTPYTVVSAPTTRSFTFTQSGVGGAYTAGGIVEKTTGLHATISAATFSGATVTVTTSTAMDLFGTTGAGGGQSDFIYFPDGIPGLTGINTGLSSPYIIQTVISSTQFTITQSGVGGSFTSGGYAMMDWRDHGIGFYCGINLSSRFENCGFHDGGRDGIKKFTSSASASTVPGSYEEYISCYFDNGAGGTSIQTSNINAVNVAVTNCTFRGSGHAIRFFSLIGSKLEVTGGYFRQGKAAISTSVTGASDFIITGAYFADPADPSWNDLSSPIIDLTSGNPAHTLKVVNSIFESTHNRCFIFCPNNAAFYGDINTCTFRGGSSRDNTLDLAWSGYTRVRFCRFEGQHSYMFDGRQSNGVELSLDYNDFFQSSGTFFLNPIANSVRGRGNRFQTVFPAWTTTTDGPLLATMSGQNPTAATSAANTTLSANHDIHKMSAVTVTVNNLWIGGSANIDRCFAGTRITLIFVGAATTISNSGGNIRTKTAADVTPAIGATMTLVKDTTSDLWREV